MRRFFYPWPVGLDPTLDGFFVSLNGPALRLLGTPTERVQDSSDMVDMIMNVKDLSDHLNDLGAGPQVRRKARLTGALQQDRFQSSLFHRPSRGGRPGSGLARMASGPPFRTLAFHRRTLRRSTPIFRAISTSWSPWSMYSRARSRLASRNSELPDGLIDSLRIRV
jgi:hypothetical protein